MRQAFTVKLRLASNLQLSSCLSLPKSDCSSLPPYPAPSITLQHLNCQDNLGGAGLIQHLSISVAIIYLRMRNQGQETSEMAVAKSHGLSYSLGLAPRTTNHRCVGCNWSCCWGVFPFLLGPALSQMEDLQDGGGCKVWAMPGPTSVAKLRELIRRICLPPAAGLAQQHLQFKKNTSIGNTELVCSFSSTWHFHLKSWVSVCAMSTA